MFRRLPACSFAALFLPLAISLAGCGAHGTPGGAPVMRATGTTAAAGHTTVSHPAAPAAPSVSRGGAFLTQLGASMPAFSPKGDRLAFTIPSRGVLLAGAEAQSPQPLAGSLPGDHDPTWSVGGDAVAVVRAGAAGGTAIVRIELQGGRVTTMFQAQGALRQPCFAPGGQSLFFVLDQGTSSLLQLDLQAGKAAALWQGPLAGSPTVSPDGRTLVFERKGADGVAGLARMSLPGGPATALLVAGSHPHHPAFSSTGRSLAYVADEGLFVSQADGTQGQHVLTAAGLDAPTWRAGQPELIVAATQGSRTDLQRVDLPAR